MLRAGEPQTDASVPGAPARTGVRRWLLLGCGSVAGLALLLVVAGLSMSRHGETQPVRATSAPLPDGSVVRLESVTYGKQHRWEPEKDPFAWLPAWVPWPSVRRPPHSIDETTVRDSAVFWITRRDAEHPRQTLDMSWWTDYEVLDEHGCRFGDGTREYRAQGPNGGRSTSTITVRGGAFPPSPPQRDTVYVGSGVLAAFPRRSSAWTLRLYGAGTQPVAEFSAPNPAPGVYPSWMPEALPATHRDGDLAITLLSVSGSEHTTANSRGRPILQRDLITTFKLLQRGRPATEWEPAETYLLDPTGNQSPVSTVSLCAREAAWKLRAKFWRTPRARFAASETWRIPGIRAPRAQQVVPLSAIITLEGVTLELMGIGGVGRFKYINGVPSAVWKSAEELRQFRRRRHGVSLGGSTSSSGPGKVITTRTDVDSGASHLGLRARGLSADQRLIVRATDERGRSFLGERHATMNGQQFFKLDIPEDARTLKLTFVVHSPRTVEFMIAPPKFVRRGGS